MSDPLISIVTPSYNQGHFIRATVESVLSQDYPHVEYIVMDGGSQDHTLEVLKEYSSRITVISEKDRGQAHAINKGFQMAKGEIVAWLNSDDTYLPGALRSGVEGCQSHPHAGAIYGDGFQIDYDGNIRQQFPFTEPFNLWKLTFVLDYILQQSVFFRRSCVEAVGWTDESLHFGMDWDLLIRLGKRFGLEHVPKLIGCLREYGEAKSFAGGAKRFQELAALLQKHTDRRHPPGWWYYGLDTYDKIWAERIRQTVPGSLGEFVARHFVYLCRAQIDRVYRGSQGLYSDQWVAPRFHWMFPECARGAVVHGWVPDWAGALSGQQFRMSVDGEQVDSRRVDPGRFSVEVPLRGGTTPVLRIDARKSWIPGRQGARIDNRRVAWQLDRIETIR